MIAYSHSINQWDGTSSTNLKQHNIEGNCSLLYIYSEWHKAQSTNVRYIGCSRFLINESIICPHTFHSKMRLHNN